MKNKFLTWPISANSNQEKCEIPLKSITSYTIDSVIFNEDLKEYVIKVTLQVSGFDDTENFSKFSDTMIASEFTKSTKIELDINEVDDFKVVVVDTTNSILSI